MKHFHTLLFVCIAALTNAQFFDDIESYGPGPIGTQSPHWTTWSGVGNPEEEAVVSEGLAYSGTKSISFGPNQQQNALLKLGEKVGGIWNLEWKMFVPSGGSAFYGFLETENPTEDGNEEIYTVNFYFNYMESPPDAPGMCTVFLNNPDNMEEAHVFEFPKDQWFSLRNELVMTEEFTNGLIRVYINDEPVFEFDFLNESNTLGSAFFRSIDDHTAAFIDDIYYYNENSEIESITVTTESGVEPLIEAGETLQLIASITPVEANQEVVWTIESGSDFVSLDENGLVTGLAPGTAVIRATSAEAPDIFGEIEIEVVAYTPEGLEVIVAYGLEPETTVGGYLPLIATILPEEANQDVIWTVESGSEFISVSESGVVTGLALGSGIIRATSAEEAAVFNEIEIQVVEEDLEGEDCGQSYTDEHLSGLNISTSYPYRTANDFDIDDNTTFHLKKVTFSIMVEGESINTGNIHLYEDNDNLPGTLIASYGGLIPTSVVLTGTLYVYNVYEVEFTLPATHTLESGNKYWIALDSDFPATAFWSTSSYIPDGTAQPSLLSNNYGGTWNANSDFDGIFEISGLCETELFISEINGLDGVTVYPNPTNGMVNIVTEKEVKSTEVLSLNGQLIKTVKGKTPDLGSLPPGTYILKVMTTDGLAVSKKLIKK